MEKEISFPQISSNAITVLERRYLKKDEYGKTSEKPDDMFRRVAQTIARASEKHEGEEARQRDEELFYHMMRKLDFIPNSPTLMNAGRKLGQLSACFVLPVGDSIEEIFQAVKQTAIIHQSGGGTGFSFSRLRPKNDIVHSTKGVSSGPISFMTVFDAATEAIKQGGTRRGANMAILSVHHPDIIEFIKAKHDQEVLNNFNISIALTDEFMSAYKKDTYYALRNPRTGEITDKIKAKEIFDLIIESAWKNGEPGIVFIDEINRYNSTPGVGDIESTNPCGEQPLLPYESCNLGSINLANMIVKEETGLEIDWNKLRHTVINATKFLDNVIDINVYPIPEIKEMTNSNRKIGLGVMGFADMLIRLGIPYDSEEGLHTGESVMKFINETAQETSIALSKVRGSFSNIHKSKYKNNGSSYMRNATRTTIAPTGTISIIANCSSGIEPLFALSYYRNVLDKDKLPETYSYFEEIATEKGFYTEELIKKIAESGSVQNCEEVPPEIRRIFVTSHDIAPEWHVKMQAAFQRYTDNAVSKTVNFSNKATKIDVKEVYMMAYNLKCKGVTVYRDGSRDEQVLNVGHSGKDRADGLVSPTPQGEAKPRPPVTYGLTRKVKTGCGNLYVTINKDSEGRTFELFCQMGKAGGCAASQSEAISRLISHSLRAGSPVETIIKQLKGISCHQQCWDTGTRISSCADAIGYALESYAKENKGESEVEMNFLFDDSELHIRGACPDCGGTLEHESGCVICKSCGYSECA
ncbi:MAG: vitamin B12-dependent ribonucleotide reductase [Pseudomonadota bacterium]